MKIGELAHKSGISASRIRFYEKAGLLKSVTRMANGYRVYSADTLMILEIIIRAQQAGFSLVEIGNLIPGDFSKWDRSKLLNALNEKIVELEAMEERLRQTKEQLKNVIQHIENKPENLGCEENTLRTLNDLHHKG